MARHDPQMNVRLPESLLAEVKREASNQRRTMTAQINLIIEEWLDSKKQQDAKA
ncbi:ribbon-helix-helix domain-containing protein [Acinetobacter baumannii]|uniref:ribbon-helix-helix domain-containing protein n=1 Tax=Acinetobacter calcoaceticus/baumannii complex TaxID=909768 RepID=UPI002955D4CB|nr:Arc family DNA-binding protein [Acinetobacter pittii]MDV8150444.1 Arc family DNA-binding protein [Acinetobacter pittii]